MKRKQGGSDEDAQHCPPHPAFVLGRCLLCGVKEKDAEVGAPGVAVGHETLKQGGDRDGSAGDDSNSTRWRCPPRPEIVQCLGYYLGAIKDDAGGSASGVPVANIDRADRVQAALAAAKSAAPRVPLGPCTSRRVLPSLGLGGSRTKEEGSAERGASGEIHDSPAAVPASTRTTSTSIPRASDLGALLLSRKLSLVLDLDHTLLNSTGLDDLSSAEKAKGFTPDRSGDPRIGLFRLESNNLGTLVKLRPFVRRFLEEASSMFEMHVYTLGNESYTKAGMDLLDTDGVYFGGRVVVCVEELIKGYRNSLDLDDIPGADPVSTVILDELLDALNIEDYAWPRHRDNIILTDRYRYFASTSAKGENIPYLAEQGLDEMEDDGSLAVALGVLKRVHKAFFDGHGTDVRKVIRELQREVLSGCTVAFSYLKRYLENCPDNSLMWKLAERLGAACQKDVDEAVTHVAVDPGTQKAQWARDKGKFLVNLEWINTAGFRLCRQDEQGFPVTAMGVERRHAVRDPSILYTVVQGLARWEFEKFFQEYLDRYRED